MTGRFIEPSDLQQGMHQTAVLDTNLAGFHETLAQASMKGNELPNQQKIGQEVNGTWLGWIGDLQPDARRDAFKSAR